MIHKRKSLWELVRYGVSSIFSFTMTLVWNYLFHECAGWPGEVAMLVAMVLVTLQNFAVMRHFVYRTQAENILRQFLHFLSSIVVFRVLEFAAYTLLCRVLLVAHMPAVVLLQVVFVLSKFAYYRTRVFHPAPVPGKGRT